MRNNPENVGDGILKMRAELKELIADEEAAAKRARKAGIAALKARHAANSTAPELPEPQGFFDKLLRKNFSYRKNRAEKLETKSREADDALRRLTESRRALTVNLARVLGVEPPANVSEEDVKEYLTNEKLQMQTASKELEDAEAALKEPSPEKENKGQEPKKPEEPPGIKEGVEIAEGGGELLKKTEAAPEEPTPEKEIKEPAGTKAKTGITDEEMQLLKNAEAEYLEAVEKEKFIQGEVQKKRRLIAEQEKEKSAIQPLSEELEEADAALKEAVSDRQRIEREYNNLKTSIETSVRTGLTNEEEELLKRAKDEHHRAVEKEKGIGNLVKKKKELVEGNPEKYKPLFQFMLKEVEDAEAALKEAVLERELKECELNNLVDRLVESVETRVKTNITEEKLEHLKKIEAEYLNAAGKEKGIGREIIKKRELVEQFTQKHTAVIQSLIKELGEAEAALKEAAGDRERKECEIRNLKKSIEIKANMDSQGIRVS